MYTDCRSPATGCGAGVYANAQSPGTTGKGRRAEGSGGLVLSCAPSLPPLIMLAILHALLTAFESAAGRAPDGVLSGHEHDCRYYYRVGCRQCCSARTVGRKYRTARFQTPNKQREKRPTTRSRTSKQDSYQCGQAALR